MRLVRDGHEINDSDHNPFGTAPHEREKVDLDKDKEKLSKHYEKGDRIQVWFLVGGGGGH